MKIRNLVTGAVALGLMPTVGSADIFHPITGIAAPGMVDGNPAGNPLSNVIQGAGSGFDLNPPHDGPSATWYTNAITANYITGHAGDEKLLFDLGSDVALGEISVWGYSAGNGNGLREFNVRFATDAEGGAAGLGDEAYGSSITLNPAYTAALNPTPRQSFRFGQAVTARYVEVFVTSNYAGNVGGVPGGDRLGVGEIAFASATEAGASNIEVADVSIPFQSSVATYDIPVTNTGQLDLNVSNAAFSGTHGSAFSLVATPAPISTWNAGNVEVQFDPTGLLGATISATMTVTSDDPDEPSVDLQISGIVGPVIQVGSPASLALGDIVEDFDITVENVGGVVLNLSGADFTGADAGAFSATVVPASIPAGGSDTLTIQFDPSGLASGLVDATLRIMSDDPTTPTAEVVLEGGVAAVFHPMSAVSTNTVNFFSKENLINGPGAGYATTWPHNATGATWVTDAPNGGAGDYYDNNQPAPVLVFDLGQDRALSEISTWGYANTNSNGGKDFTLRFATEADGDTNFGASITYSPSFAAAFSATSRDSHPFNRIVTVRYVEMTITDNWRGMIGFAGGDRVGLGEVAFEDRSSFIPTQYVAWSSANVLTGASAMTTADLENSGAGDGLENLLEFAFGTNPNVADNLPLEITSGTTFTPGTPLANVEFSPLNLSYRFVRRVGHAAAGLVYTPQFTADGMTFENSTDTPTVVVPDDGTGYEVVEVPFMIFLPSGMKSDTGLARVSVTLAP